MLDPDEQNDLGGLLARADAPARRSIDRAATAAGALRQVRRRRQTGRIRNGVVSSFIVVIAGIGMWQFRPRPPAGINVAQLQAEIAQLNARADELTLAVARAKNVPPVQLARSVYDEER